MGTRRADHATARGTEPTGRSAKPAQASGRASSTPVTARRGLARRVGEARARGTTPPADGAGTAPTDTGPEFGAAGLTAVPTFGVTPVAQGDRAPDQGPAPTDTGPEFSTTSLASVPTYGVTPVAQGARAPDQGPAGAPGSFQGFSEAERDFLQGMGIDAAGLDPVVAQRLASLLAGAQQAISAAAAGGAPTGMSGGTSATVNQSVGSTGAELSVTVANGQASVLIGRRMDFATGGLTLQFAYKDSDGNRIEVETTVSGTPKLLDTYTMGGEFTAPKVLSVPTGPEQLPLIQGPESTGEPDDLLSLEGEEEGSSEGIGSFLEGAIYGDFGENDSWSAIAGQIVVGFIPIVGQIADVRDLWAALEGVADGREGAWVNVGVAVVAFVPGLDFLKGGTRLGRRALKELAEESITPAAKSGLERARQVLSAKGAQLATKRLRALAAGRVELMQRLAELSGNTALRTRTRDLLKHARNAVEDHMRPEDLTGALGDRLGQPLIWKESGEAIQHLNEVQVAIASVQTARRALLGELQRLAPGSEAYQAVARELAAMSEMRRKVLEFLDTR